MYPNQYKLDLNVKGLLLSILIMLIFMPIQSGFEEAVFRGYLMQGFALWFKNGWMALLMTSLLFGLAHMSNPEVGEYGWPMMLSYYAFFALFMGAITLLDEGLELAMGVHLANNMMASVMVCSDHSVIKTYSIFTESKGQPTFELLIWLLFATLVFFIFKKKYAWKNFTLILR
ncbi:MAG: CPBP family intramembrane glutamic endopeptidase, partial [Bacteroidota bacterium]